MIQFNLLPDIKQKYLKAQRQKHLVVFISTITSIIAVSVFIILVLVVQVWQKASINDLNSDIKKYSNELSDTPELDKILTVQNQLNSIEGLHDQKPAASRLFAYITQLTPASASVSKLEVNFDEDLLTITGSADSLATVNTYVDTLKFTEFKTTEDNNSKKAFSNVVLTSFSRKENNTTYTITANFDPILFDQKDTVSLSVPKKTTTRSSTEQPTDLFQQSQTQTNTGQDNQQ